MPLGAGPLTLAGVAFVLYVLYNWFGDTIAESNAGKNGVNVDISYRWSMAWFIFSEIMFFGAFFAALFYARNIAMPWMGDVESKLLWPNFQAVWPMMVLLVWLRNSPPWVLGQFQQSIHCCS